MKEKELTQGAPWLSMRYSDQNSLSAETELAGTDTEPERQEEGFGHGSTCEAEGRAVVKRSQPLGRSSLTYGERILLSLSNALLIYRSAWGPGAMRRRTYSRRLAIAKTIILSLSRALVLVTPST